MCLHATASEDKAVYCPLDHVIWKESISGREFVATKAAQQLVYNCDGKFVETEDEINGCGNPRGTFYIGGMIGVQPAYAILRIGYSAPCCSWESKAAPDKALEAEVKRWRKSGTAIEIPLQDETFTIGTDTEEGIGGPLNGGYFVPAVCRR